MRKPVALLLFILLSAMAVHSQLSSVKGTITDTAEKKNLSHAVILLLRNTDSVLVKFSRSDNQGNFDISNVGPGDYVLMISYPKFADYKDKVTLQPSQALDLGTIPLTPKAMLLQEVVLKNNGAIRIKGDTTEFTADSFKVKEGATVEDLLKQIPGMQVNSKGEVTAQGKRVDKVLVDGEEFFGEDPTIATQNIGAKAVDKVQVYDTKTEQDQLKGIGTSGDGNKTINIKLKESAKKGYFGTVEAGTDFQKLLNAKGMYNKFRGNKKISVYSTKSNTSTGSLGWEDRNKLGIENDFEYDEISGFYYSYGDGDDDFNDWNLRGIPNAYTAGALYGNKWNEEKDKLNLSYLYNRLGTTNTTKTVSQTLLEDTTFFNNAVSKSRGLSQQHALNGKYEWKIDSLTSLKYTVAGTYKIKDTHTDNTSEALDENKEPVNTNDRTNDLHSVKKQVDNMLTYKQLFRKKDRQLIATFRLGIINDEQTGKLLSTTDFYKNGVVDSVDVIDQMKINSGNSTTIGTKITYNEPLTSKWNLVTEYSLNNNHSTSHRNSFDKDLDQKYTDLNAVFSNNFDLTALANSGTITARYVGKKLRAAFGAGLSAIQLNLDDLDGTKKTKYNFTGFTPQAQFGYRFKPQTGISFSYRGNTVQPTLSQLQPLHNNNDPLSIYIGNPDLKVGFSHTLNFNFNDYKVLKGRYLFGNFTINFLQNAITNQSSTDSFGKTTYIPVNVHGNNNWNFWSVWNSGQGDKKLVHEIQPQADGGRSVSFLNGKENVNTYANFTLSYRLRYSVADKYNFSAGPMIKRNISKSSLRPSANNNYWNYGGQADGYVKLFKKLELSSDIDINLQQKTAAFGQGTNIIVWNAELSRKFTKDKSFKIALVAHDILNQNIGFTRTINSNFINEERYDKLSRYFLLKASWTFNKMPGKK
jgi:Outer membrane protein beta-barrel family/Carboxypeptidase regulatory-like domain